MTPGFGQADCVVEVFQHTDYRGNWSYAYSNSRLYATFSGLDITSIYLTKGCKGIMIDDHGNKQEFEDGFSNLGVIGWNDRVKAIIIEPLELCRVRVFGNQFFGRGWVDVVDKAPNLGQSSIGNNEAKSYRIIRCHNKDVHFCYDWGFRGRCVKYYGAEAMNYVDWGETNSVTIDDRGYKTTL